MRNASCIRAGMVAAVVAGVAFAVPLHADEHEGIPAFARKYNLSCIACHAPIPTLNAFGEQFAGNGFRLAPGVPTPGNVETGDDQLSLSSDVPLAFRLDAYVQGFTNGTVATDIQAPYNLKILSGGAISSKLSYYLYFFLFERGEVGGVEDAFIYINDIADQPVDVAIGQFQVSDPLFKRELRLEFQDYAIYRARLGSQPADLTYDRGIMVMADIGGFTVTGEVVNGNGRGEAGANRRLDNDLAKNFFGHVTRELGSNIRLGLMGYRGKQTGVSGAGPETDNTIWMLGGDATFSMGPVEINGQYVHREDDAPTFDPTELSVETDGGFVELLYRPPGSRWYGLGLYNYVDASRPLLNVRLGGPSNISRYQTLTGGVGYMVRTNFRVLGELTWDIEQEGTRWTFGLVSAF